MCNKFLSPLPGLGPRGTLVPPINRWAIVGCPWRDKECGGLAIGSSRRNQEMNRLRSGLALLDLLSQHAQG